MFISSVHLPQTQLLFRGFTVPIFWEPLQRLAIIVCFVAPKRTSLCAKAKENQPTNCCSEVSLYSFAPSGACRMSFVKSTSGPQKKQKPSHLSSPQCWTTTPLPVPQLNSACSTPGYSASSTNKERKKKIKHFQAWVGYELYVDCNTRSLQESG